MAEKAAKVMEEFGFCPTWGFIQPEPLEALGQHFLFDEVQLHNLQGKPSATKSDVFYTLCKGGGSNSCVKIDIADFYNSGGLLTA